MKYAFFPGCSSENLASSYAASLQAVTEVLGVDLRTVPDWNCCGATQYKDINRIAAHALCARNLALVPEDCEDLVASCSACYLNLRQTDQVMRDHRDIGEKVNRALAAGGLSHQPGRFGVRHLLDVLISDVGLDVIGAAVRRPLAGLRIAPYYGCMLVRPLCCFDHPEYPTSMDDLFRVLGAEVVDFSLRGYCCGGHLPHIKTDTGFTIIERILANAQASGADCIAVACPVCQANLDIYQRDVNRQFKTSYAFPVLFFTQLMGIAYAIDFLTLGIGKETVHIGDVLALVAARGIAPATADVRPASALPMPKGLEDRDG